MNSNRTFHPLIHRVHRVLRNRLGALALGTVFIAFSAITVLTGVSVVAQTMVTSTQATQATAVDSQMEARSTSLRADLISGNTPDTECLDRSGSAVSCAELAASPDDQTVMKATIQGQHELMGEQMSQELTLHRFEANYIAGFDANGDPVWVDETGSKPHSFKQIVSSGDRITALDHDGYAWSWGANDYGQLGTGDNADRTEPTQVAPPAGHSEPVKFERLTRGTDSAVCGLEAGGSNAGRLWCWGYNTNGQLGQGADAVGAIFTKPVAPATSLRFTDVEMSSNTTCAISTAGNLHCWGANPGTGSATAAPASSPVLTGVRDVAMDANTVVAVRTDGKLHGWARTMLGQPGVAPSLPATGGGGMSTIIPTGQPGDPGGGPTPIDVPGKQFEKVFVAPEETGLVKTLACALTTSGEGYCWGVGGKGQLGNGSYADSPTPVKVSTTTQLETMAMSSDTVVAVAKNGRLLSWGDGSKGQLGTSSTGRSTPAFVGSASNYKDVEAATGNKQTFCTLDADGIVSCFGNNDHGQTTGGGSAANAPRKVSDRPAADFALGDEFACSSGMSTNCWGRNTLGQMGRGMVSLREDYGPVASRAHHYDTFTGYVPGGSR